MTFVGVLLFMTGLALLGLLVHSNMANDRERERRRRLRDRKAEVERAARNRL
jgi:hypothetical protein